MVELVGKGKLKRVWFVQHPSIIPIPLIAVTATKEAFDFVIKHLGVNDVDEADGVMSGSDARAWRMARGNSAPVYCVQINHESLLGNKVDVPAVAGLLAHEAVHVSDWMLEHMGEDEPGMEFRANLVQFLTMGLLEAYEKLVPKKERYGGLFR